RDDGGDHPARQRPADRRREGEGPRRAARRGLDRHPAGGEPEKPRGRAEAVPQGTPLRLRLRRQPGAGGGARGTRGPSAGPPGGGRPQRRGAVESRRPPVPPPGERDGTPMPRSLSEDRFIRLMLRLSRGRGPRPVVGIGDDAAVLASGAKSRTLVTTDFLTEGVHFLRTKTPPRLLGRKAMAVNLSDIAAMGGVPLSAVVSVGLPRATTWAWARGLAEGIAAMARRHRVTIVGGDTCLAERVFVSVTLLGAVEIGGEVRRSGARAGDRLYVTGRLGA